MNFRESINEEEPDGGMIRDWIIVRGARVHNLKNVDLEIPHGKLTILTGVSGSGKSSLAYDTIFAEGRRIYLESLCSGTGQLTEILEPVDVDSISGLPPPVSVSQHPGTISRRSTVGSITRLNELLQFLYANVGIPHCPQCGETINRHSPEEIIQRIAMLESGRKVMIMAPLVRQRKGAHTEVLRNAVRDGFVRARIDGELFDLSTPPILPKHKYHSIDLVIDRIIVKEGLEERLRESIRPALIQGKGSCLVVVQTENGWEDRLYSSRFFCTACGESLKDIETRSFNFNSPYGACNLCSGLGILDESFNRICPECEGERLSKIGRSVTLGGISLPAIWRLNLNEMAQLAKSWLDLLQQKGNPAGFKPDTSSIAVPLIKSLVERLEYLLRVGVGYLSPDRSIPTLSGGEFQRVRLAEALGNRLCGACYILDEPTSGLHPLDTERLLQVLVDLRDQGNTLVLIEHDPYLVSHADYLLEIGPGAGKFGGEILACGSPAEIRNNENSITSVCMLPDSRAITSLLRPCDSVDKLRLEECNLHNLKSVNLEFPLGRFTCITGVSGSGKSTLARGALMPLLRQHVGNGKNSANESERQRDGFAGSGRLSGWEPIERVVEVDQSRLGRSARSNPATVSGIWNNIRRLYATTRDARIRGFSAEHFSMHLPQGRCPGCHGRGVKRLSTKFSEKIEVVCPNCHGKLFNRETLSIRYRGLNVFEVLSLSIRDALDFFASFDRIHGVLRTFDEVDLGYLKLGQSAASLSSGESQRVKLACALSAEGNSKTLFFLDEPTTGLHVLDIHRLLTVMQRLVGVGHTVIAIEHQMDLIGAADWIVELGPGAGPSGGTVVEEGSPEDLIKSGSGVTASSLRDWLRGYA